MSTAKPLYKSKTLYMIALSVITRLLTSHGISETDASSAASELIEYSLPMLPLVGLAIDFLIAWFRARANGPLTLTRKAAENHNADANMQAGYARPMLVVLLTALAALTLGLLQGCTTTPTGGRELSATGKVALQEVAAIATRRYLRDHAGRATEIANNIRAVATELQKATSATTLADLRVLAETEVAVRISDAEDLQDAISLLRIFEAVLHDQIGSNELDSAALVRVNEFAGFIVTALPAP